MGKKITIGTFGGLWYGGGVTYINVVLSNCSRPHHAVEVLSNLLSEVHLSWGQLRELPSAL